MLIEKLTLKNSPSKEKSCHCKTNKQKTNVARLGIFFLCLILEENQLFTICCDVSCGFFIYGLCYVYGLLYIPFLSTLFFFNPHPRICLLLVASHMCPDWGDQIHNLGMCPHWELNLQSLSDVRDNTLTNWETLPGQLYTHFVENFYHECMLNFVNWFFCIYWDDQWFLSFILLMWFYHID